MRRLYISLFVLRSCENVRADLQSVRIEYEHLQCAFIGLQILIFTASGFLDKPSVTLWVPSGKSR